MKYVDEYRDGDKARDIAAAIAAEVRPDRSYALMEFCGGHTHALSRYGIEDLLPANVRMIHGPGCPVCVLPIGRIDDAIRLARRPEVTLCTYADLMRVPASGGLSLMVPDTAADAPPRAHGAGHHPFRPAPRAPKSATRRPPRSSSGTR